MTPTRPIGATLRRGFLLALVAIAILGSLGAADIAAGSSELTAAKAVLLGVIEGVTEFLPISSTGHLLVSESLLGVGTHGEASKAAADAYSIVIQGGAILAVFVLYFARVRQIMMGLIGRDDDGRRLLINLVIAFAPAVVVGLAAEKSIKQALFGPVPVIVAWVVGGLVILWLSKVGTLAPDREGRRSLAELTPRHAAIIGVAQVVAMWPGTSRSLVTIVAAALLGYSLAAAVEFAFVLGLVTLSAATAYDLLKHGDEITTAYGAGPPLIGFVTAFVAALVAIKWMVGYLQSHSFAIFGWYRLAVAAVTVVLIASGTMVIA